MRARVGVGARVRVRVRAKVRTGRVLDKGGVKRADEKMKIKSKKRRDTIQKERLR